MKNCPKCSTAHKKPGRFCSRACANSRERGAAVREKLSEANKSYWSSLEGSKLEDRKAKCSVSVSIARVAAHDARRAVYDAKPFSELSWELQRRRVIQEQNNKCSKCGLNEWRGQPLPLEVDHKDGDNGNNTRDNLEALCPNCHSITPTWRGRNISNNRRKVSDEELTQALRDQNRNIRQALLQVGMAAKGANYGRAKALLLLMDQLP